MTDTNKTEIAVILDRSGSMSTIQAAMVQAFASFIAEQRAHPGLCAVSLYQFDDHYDVVYEGKPIAEVGALALLPRGWTALYDAMGKSIVRLGERLSAMPEEQRPAAVIVIVITDGQENKSTEYTGEQVRALVGRQETTYGWRFLYLGAAASTFADASKLGIQAVAQYSPDAASVGKLAAESSKSVGAYRSAVRAGNPGASLNVKRDLTSRERP
jgi:hypothetical protein